MTVEDPADISELPRGHVSEKLAPPGPERRAQLEARGRRVGIQDFTPEEIAEAEDAVARVMRAFQNGEGTQYKPPLLQSPDRTVTNRA